MKIYFHGATGHVTGSAYHVKTKRALSGLVVWTGQGALCRRSLEFIQLQEITGDYFVALVCQ